MARALIILVVEDHADTADMMARLLRAYGHEVDVAAACGEAKAMAASRQYDLVIADVGLPDGDGRELMAHLRAAHRVRGVAVTGHGHKADVDACYASGFDKVLLKPVGMGILRTAIQEIQSLPPLPAGGEA